MGVFNGRFQLLQSRLQLRASRPLHPSLGFVRFCFRLLMTGCRHNRKRAGPGFRAMFRAYPSKVATAASPADRSRASWTG